MNPDNRCDARYCVGRNICLGMAEREAKEGHFLDFPCVWTGGFPPPDGQQYTSGISHGGQRYLLLDPT